MEIKVITKDNCSFCIRAKTLLSSRKLLFDEILLDRDIDLDTVRSTYPSMRTFPIIVVNDKVVGGYDSLVERIAENEYFGQTLIKG
jgi:glutaredoxin